MRRKRNAGDRMILMHEDLGLRHVRGTEGLVSRPLANPSILRIDGPCSSLSGRRLRLCKYFPFRACRCTFRNIEILLDPDILTWKICANRSRCTRLRIFRERVFLTRTGVHRRNEEGEEKGAEGLNAIIDAEVAQQIWNCVNRCSPGRVSVHR